MEGLPKGEAARSRGEERRLRAKNEENPARPELIETVWGYRLPGPDEEGKG